MMSPSLHGSMPRRLGSPEAPSRAPSPPLPSGASSDVARVRTRLEAWPHDDVYEMGSARPAPPHRRVTSRGLDPERSARVRRWVRDASEAQLWPPSEGEDLVLRDLLGELGFDGPPECLTPEALDVRVREGAPELFRGVTHPEFAEAFRSGPLYVGTGSAGNGIYCARRERIEYARGKATAEGALLRLSLHREARVACDEEVDAEMFEAYERAAAQVDRSDPTALDQLRRLELLLYTDPGRFAASRGLDAIDLPHRGMMLVLNRTALSVERA